MRPKYAEADAPPRPLTPGKLKFSLAGGSSFSASAFAYTPRMPGDRPHSRTPAAPAPASAPGAAADTSAGCSNGAPGSTVDGSAGAGSAAAVGSQAAAGVTGSSTSAPAAGRCAAGQGTPGTVEPTPPAAPDAAAGGSRHAQSWPEPGPGPGVETGPAGPGPAGPGPAGPGPGFTAAAAAAAVALGELRHPRSSWLRAQLPEPEAHFRILAKVGRAHCRACRLCGAAVRNGGFDAAGTWLLPGRRRERADTVEGTMIGGGCPPEGDCVDVLPGFWAHTCRWQTRTTREALAVVMVVEPAGRRQRRQQTRRQLEALCHWQLWRRPHVRRTWSLTATWRRVRTATARCVVGVKSSAPASAVTQ